LGRLVRVTQERGKFLAAAERNVLITMHPSGILRLREQAEREAAYRRFVDELKRARSRLVP
jgi:DNA polymerase